MIVVIIGMGSIAQKHIIALKRIDPNVVLYAIRSNSNAKSFEGITNLYSLRDLPLNVDFFIVSNPTSLHSSTLEELVVLNIPIFLEKPPLLNLESAEHMVSRINQAGLLVYTAFNMRFHPLIEWARQFVPGKRVLEVNAYCGSYLPDWRPGIDYRTVYSAKKELGGGVHLDLIHELDYLIYIFGKPTEVAHKFGRVSCLEINSIDSAYYWLDYKGFVANVSLNYFRRVPKRVLDIIFEDEVIQIDLINYTAQNANSEIVFSAIPDIQLSYDRQMIYFINALKDNALLMNSFENSIETLKICLDES